MNNILDIILKDSYTLNLVKHRVKTLKSYLISQLFSREKAALESEDLIWLNSLDTSFYQQFSKDNIYEIFSDIEAKIGLLPLLNIYVPFATNAQVISQIGQYLRNTFGKIILFDTKFDPNLIAGCALSWKGIYRDYSLRSDRKS